MYCVYACDKEKARNALIPCGVFVVSTYEHKISSLFLLNWHLASTVLFPSSQAFFVLNNFLKQSLMPASPSASLSLSIRNLQFSRNSRHIKFSPFWHSPIYKLPRIRSQEIRIKPQFLAMPKNVLQFLGVFSKIVHSKYFQLTRSPFFQWEELLCLQKQRSRGCRTGSRKYNAEIMLEKWLY